MKMSWDQNQINFILNKNQWHNVKCIWIVCNDECNVCVSKELLQDDNVCYNEFDNKQEYRLFLRKSEYYQQIEEIIQWNAIKIIEIKESDHSVRNDKYGEYGNNNKVEKVYTVIVQIDKEYILFRDYIKGHKNIQYQTCEMLIKNQKNVLHDNQQRDQVHQ